MNVDAADSADRGRDERTGDGRNMDEDLPARQVSRAQLEDSLLERLAREILMVDGSGESLIPKYERIIENGLDGAISAGVQRRDVLIVGAGIAGLLAGRILKKANYNVTILEANDNRIGGRIKTFQSGSFYDPRLYAEAGAMRIPTTHPLLNKLIAVVGLDKQTQGFFNVDVAPDDEDRKVFRTLAPGQ